MGPSIASSRSVINFLLFFFVCFFWPLKKICLEWVYFPLDQILLVFWKLSKWENKPFYPIWVRHSKHKIKITACSAPRMVNPSEGPSVPGVSPLAFARAGASRFSFGMSFVWPMQSRCDYGKLGVIQMTQCSFQTICVEALSPLKGSMSGFNSLFLRSLCIHFCLLGNLINLIHRCVNCNNSKNNIVDIKS